MTHLPDWLINAKIETPECEQLRDFFKKLHDPKFQKLYELRLQKNDPSKSSDPKIKSLNSQQMQLTSQGMTLFTNLSVFAEFDKNPERLSNLVVWLFDRKDKPTTKLEEFRANENPNLSLTDAFKHYLKSKNSFLRKDENRGKTKSNAIRSLDRVNDNGRTLLDEIASSNSMSYKNNSLEGIADRDLVEELKRLFSDLEYFKRMEPDCEFPEETMFIARKKFFNDKPTSDENIAIQLSEYFTKARVRGIYERNRDSIIKGILPRAVERHGFDISLSRVSPKNSKSQVTGENNIDRKLEQTETSNTLQLPKHGLSLDKMIQLTKKLNPDTNKELPAVSNSSAEQAEDEKKNIKYSE